MLLCSALAAAHLAAAQSLGSIDSCIKRLDPQADVGYERVAARCPDLIRQLDQSSWSVWLPRGWNESGNGLSAGSLKELRELASHELGTTLRVRAPDVQRLDPILAQLGTTDSERGSGWASFKAWLRSVARSQARGERDSGGWITRMIAQVGLSQAILELMAYAVAVLVVILAGGIVLNELRVAGWLRGWSLRAAKVRAPQAVARTNLRWSDIERALPQERPGLLLGLISQQLAERGLLPPSGALTIRELLREARLSARLSAADRARLTELALTAEQVRYSGHEVDADRLEAPLIRGRELLEGLA
jgi:hypothetical protein